MLYDERKDPAMPFFGGELPFLLVAREHRLSVEPFYIFQEVLIDNLKALVRSTQALDLKLTVLGVLVGLLNAHEFLLFGVS